MLAAEKFSNHQKPIAESEFYVGVEDKSYYKNVNVKLKKFQLIVYQSRIIL